MKKTINQITLKLALAGFKIEAISLKPENPFEWASGWRSPIYNDNRMFLFYPEYLKLIIDGLKILKDKFAPGATVIAGTSTAGIPHAAILANRLKLPMIYVRDKPKTHGKGNQIEGKDDLNGEGRVILIEDLISTGGSSVNAVQAIRNANGIIDCSFSIFNYGFPKAKAMFNAEIPYDKEGNKLEIPCEVHSILTYPLLLEVGVANGYITKAQQSMLKDWSTDPEKWSNDWKTKNENKVLA